jgi:hypothetical protein
MVPEEISMKRMAQVKTPRHRRDTAFTPNENIFTTTVSLWEPGLT